MLFNEKDKALHKGLIKLLNDGTYPLMRKEINAFIAIDQWLGSLMDKECECCKKRAASKKAKESKPVKKAKAKTKKAIK